ncbi:MAG: hypothetical protein WC718_06660 [Phycisphaerales bacterium]
MSSRAVQIVIDEFTGASHEVVAVGAGACACFGTAPLWCRAHRVAVPADCLWLATGALKAATASLGQPGVVLCWGRGLADVAQRVWAAETPVTSVDLCVGTVTTRRNTTGSPLLSAFPLRSTWLSSLAGPREGMRQSLGIAPDETVIAMAGDADIVSLAFVTGILQVAGLNVRGLVGAGAWGLRRSRRHARDRAGARDLIVVDGAVADALSACDLILVGGDPGRDQGRLLAVALGQAAGVPAIAGPHAGMDDMFRGRLKKCVARSWAYSDLAAACRRLIEDDALRKDCAMLGAAPSDGMTLGTQLRAAWKVAGVEV